VAYFILRFTKPRRRDRVVPASQHMIEASSAALAKDRADQIAERGGGRRAPLQLFNEIGLVSSRTARGVWSR
jgi:hypothetical protein